MRRVLLVLTLLILWIAACVPDSASTEEASDAGNQPTSTSIPMDSSPEPAPSGLVEEAVIKQLAANLGLQENDISVISTEETEFGDACLGVAMEGVMCAQVVTPGWVIVLEANGIQYKYHTSEDASRVQPVTLALVWKREGGIAGFCDTLTIFRSGEVFASKCDSQTDSAMGTFVTLMTAKEMQQFNGWITTFDETQLDASDPKGVADRMVVTLDFLGLGNKSPTESEQQALFNFAQEVYQELSQ